MADIEIARPADGTEHHLKDKPVRGANLSLDNDEDIYHATDKSDGKWRYSVNGRLIAETQAPDQVTASIISQWGDAVRARCTREHNLEKAPPMEKNEQRILTPDGTPADSQPDTPVPAAPAPSVDDDPDAFIQSKIDAAEKRRKAAWVKSESLREELDELAKEIDAADADKAKWVKMKEAMDV